MEQVEEVVLAQGSEVEGLRGRRLFIVSVWDDKGILKEQKRYPV